MTRDRLDPQLVAAIDRAREDCARALGRQRRDPAECDDAHARYSAALAAAGLPQPPPWQDWPTPATPPPPRRTQTPRATEARASDRSTTA